MTLTLNFDLLLKNFNLVCYLVMVADRRASLFTDNSYWEVKAGRGSLGHIRMFCCGAMKTQHYLLIILCVRLSLHLSHLAFAGRTVFFEYVVWLSELYVHIGVITVLYIYMLSEYLFWISFWMNMRQIQFCLNLLSQLHICVHVCSVSDMPHTIFLWCLHDEHLYVHVVLVIFVFMLNQVSIGNCCEVSLMTLTYSFTEHLWSLR